MTRGEQALAGYPYGPDAPQAALERALTLTPDADAIVLVEGISDQIAIETLATRQGFDLQARAIVVVPIGGAQAAGNYMSMFGPGGQGLPLAGFCDADAAETFRRAVVRADVGSPVDVSEMAALGFHLCHRDLEDELIRAAGTDTMLVVVESQGELGSFHTMQKQVKWRGRATAEQLHRFIRSKATRSQRYARVVLEVIEPEQAPAPLVALLSHLRRQ